MELVNDLDFKIIFILNSYDKNTYQNIFSTMLANVENTINLCISKYLYLEKDTYTFRSLIRKTE